MPPSPLLLGTMPPEFHGTGLVRDNNCWLITGQGNASHQVHCMKSPAQCNYWGQVARKDRADRSAGCWDWHRRQESWSKAVQFHSNWKCCNILALLHTALIKISSKPHFLAVNTSFLIICFFLLTYPPALYPPNRYNQRWLTGKIQFQEVKLT